MLTSSEAKETILGRIVPVLDRETVSLEGASGRVLAAAVVSDVDLPPFEKSAMDGYAVHSADLGPRAAPTGERTLPIVGESRAGAPLGHSVPPGACAAIYTGAELPEGCDAVVMVERSTPVEGLDPEGRSRVRLADRPGPGQHVCHRGQDLARDQAVLEPGRRLRDVDLALLAAVGCEPVPVLRRPRVAVLTSGDELVPPDVRPGVGQIREGNTLHLAAMTRRAGADVVRRGIVRDDPAELERVLGEALENCDALVTTGGVSMGRYDLVGESLTRLGVEPLFHRVAIKPGKPLWFGARGRVPVFALPGNPVSCLVNHSLFVRPALLRLGGERVEEREEAPRLGRWCGPAARANPREQYLPVRRSAGEDGLERLEPVRWNGSADVVGIARAEALAIVPAGSGVEEGGPCAWLPLE
jgi:molybdopterin molybdotransferase